LSSKERNFERGYLDLRLAVDDADAAVVDADADKVDELSNTS
jgi:hypothetical protein